MNFRSYAKKHTSGSSVLQERTKIETDALIAKYPQGVTITEFDFLDSTDGGKILSEMFAGIVSEFADLEEARSAYEAAAEDEKIRVKLSHARSKKGQRYTKVETVD